MAIGGSNWRYLQALVQRCGNFVIVCRILLHGHDEFEDSRNQGNFLELLMLLSDQNENLIALLSKDVLEHLELTAPSIQKDIVNAIAVETTNAIVRELGDGMFSIVFDKSWDASMEEQLIVSLRYVHGRGYVIEQFLGIKQISSSSVLSLEKAVEDLFSTHIDDISRLRGQSYDEVNNIDISRLRGQSYDEVNNIDMQGEFNKFTTLIMEENESAYYVHCFAKKVELTLVEAAKSHIHIATLFYVVSKVVKVDGAPCNHQDIPWGKTLMSLISMFSDVLDAIAFEGSYSNKIVPTCVAFLNPSDSFVAFDTKKLISVAQFYLKDFPAIELTTLPIQLENFIIDMRSSVEFSNLKGISDLVGKMVETRKERIYFLVYKLLTLALILPIVTATIERAFFAPKTVKTRLRDENGDQLMNDSLVVYNEGGICRSIPNEAIMHRFQNMGSL
ncbi:uncharacterized protein LOC114308920 [Camellia sinensis]|uniref:uncharacterized protein LOC114308920 n=1 Tax=Camellia sinensis TaxID=4442 RepID=UPI0010362B92|nr:uncharacterized protein LOC114308920 [Camellia sinensis]